MYDPNPKLCQSCAMPLAHPAQLGTEADGSPSPDYCAHCYQRGRFVGEMTMEEMMAFCLPHTLRANPGLTEEQAKAWMRQTFPRLKRWRTP